MTDAPDLSRVTFESAIAWFRSRVPVTVVQWRRLRGMARRQAFFVSNVSRLDVVSAVWRAIDRAADQGLALEDFQREVGEKLLREWQGTQIDPATRLETIYRTNVQSAYSAGRHQQMTDPDVLAARPFWLYDALIDTRTSRLCSSLHGTLLPAEHAFWRSHYPPNHFNCRSGVRTLTPKEAERRGGVTPGVPELTPDKGFDRAPALGDWTPDLSKYPAEVVFAYQSVLGEEPTSESD